MVKKIICLLAITITAILLTTTRASAQYYATEGVEDEQGTVHEWAIDYNGIWHELETSPLTGDGIAYPTGQHIDWESYENDPRQDDDWAYPDWADMMDYLNFLQENQLDEDDGPSGPLSNTNQPSYYILSSTDSYNNRYPTGSQITVLAKTGTKAFLNFQTTDPAIRSSQLRWEKDGRAGCSGVAYCEYSTATPGTYTIKVYNTTNNTVLVEIKLVVSDKSIIKFHKNDSYNGEYGFDETGYQYASLIPVSNYQSMMISSYNYNIPWMSLLDKQTAQVKLESLLTDADINDPNFTVTFRPTNTHITINGLSELTNITANQLKSPAMATLNIYSEEWDNTMANHSQEAIEVVNNTGQVIGKLNLSCQKPEEIKVVIVYVNTGTGYRNNFTGAAQISKDVLLSKLNANSHNQIYKKWVEVTSYPVTLDLTTEYAANPNSPEFTNVDNIPAVLANYYKTKNGVDWVTINNGKNPPDRTYFHFVTDIPNASWAGTVNLIGSVLGCILQAGDYDASLHELGHNMNLAHTFDSGTSPFAPGIPKKSTLNIMDYSNKRNMFFYYQWPKSY